MKGFNTGDGYMGMVDGEYKTGNMWNIFPTHVLY